MTISTTSASAVFLGNDATNPFTFSFVCDSASTFSAIYTDADGVQTLLSASQYTLTLNAPAVGSLHSVGGTILYPKVGSPIATGTSLTVTRTVPLAQTVSISNQGDFAPTVIEQALDALCLEIQQVSARTGQSRGTWTSGTAYNFGDIVQDGATGTNTLNYYTCIIANTSGTWATDLAAGDWSLSFNTQEVSDFATDAETAATAAAASATAAATSATSAATSATTATTQASTATTQATAAASSASSASTSASTATTQASAAATSATAAASSASSASSSASTATTQASAAATSATAAASSATAAAASATAAASTLTATSTTSLAIGTGAKTFTTQASKNFLAGQFLLIASNANSANYMHGQITSYSSTSLVMNITDIGGSGTKADWNISVSGTQGSGTVTSVTFTGDGTVLSSTPSSAVTTTGTLLASLATHTANTIFSGPTSGGAVAPTFRSLVAADYPAGTVPLTSLATQATDTFLANATGGTASPTAVALAASQLAGKGSSGNIAAIALGTNLSMSGATLNVNPQLVLLGTATASASSTLSFTSLMTSSYNRYLAVIADLVTSANADVQLKVSATNGGAYGGLPYQQAVLSPGGATAPSYAGATATIPIGATPGTLDTYIGTVIINVNWGTNKSGLIQSLLTSYTASTLTQVVANGNAGVINAIQFLPASGNFTSGNIYLYGIKNT